MRGDESRFWSKKVPKRDFSFKEVLVYGTFSVVSNGSFVFVEHEEPGERTVPPSSWLDMEADPVAQAGERIEAFLGSM